MRRPSGAERAARDAEFRRLIDEAKERHNISDVAARTRKIKPVGREFQALCAFHEERSPSMRLNDAKGTFHCFGCGRSGDIVKYVMETEGLGFIDAVRFLGANLPVADPIHRAKAAEEDAALRRAAIEEARSVWVRAIAPEGTPAGIYLRSRGITMPPPPSIRFAEVFAWRDKDTGEVGPDLPALIGGVVNATGEIVAIQRIFLRADGTGKARMKKPKLSLGRVRGGALRLNPPHRPVQSEVIVCEGPEDGLSLAQALPEASVWVTLGTAMMPEVDYPPEITSIVIAGQNDAAGRAAVEKAQAGLLERGFAVRTIWPGDSFKDWNDQLRGIRC